MELQNDKIILYSTFLAEEIPAKDCKMIVQEYINNPMLINGLKFDIRIYVLMTSIEPLRLYIFEDGLVRFATKSYSNKMEDLCDHYIHLTNYTINKDNPSFVHSEQPDEFTGHKWSLKTLWRYFERVLNKEWRPVWEETKEVCVKTLACGHHHIQREVATKIGSHYNCYKLFGFDVMFDDKLKPWLIEVNNIPSLFTNTVDCAVNRIEFLNFDIEILKQSLKCSSIV